jgi:hypothetical protein
MRLELRVFQSESTLNEMDIRATEMRRTGCSRTHVG